MNASIELTHKMLDRVRRLASARGQSITEPRPLVLDALARGLARWEAQSRLDEDTLAPASGPVVEVRVAQPEARRIVRRDGTLAFGSRTEMDRRGTDRGGRRAADRRDARQVVVDRVLSEIEAGLDAKCIAEGLTMDGFTTAGGRPWTKAAIQQLLRLEMDRRAHTAWTPVALNREAKGASELD